MSNLDVIDVSQYAKKYGLKWNIATIRKIEPPRIDINQPGLLMHGSEADPYSILKYGIVPQQSKDNTIDRDWQVCIGMNSKNPNIMLKRELARKNSAAKYCGYFSPTGIIYIIDENVKLLDGYVEFWDQGEDARGYAWVKHPIAPGLIVGLITENISLAAAAVLSTETQRPIFKPDGTCFLAEPLK